MWKYNTAAAPLDVRNKRGETALSQAKKRRHAEIVSLLVGAAVKES